jgi:hypothetical protein
MMVGYWVSGAWNVGQPASSQRSGRKLSGSGYFVALRRNPLYESLVGMILDESY